MRLDLMLLEGLEQILNLSLNLFLNLKMLQDLKRLTYDKFQIFQDQMFIDRSSRS